MDKLKFSILIPTYKGAELIKDSLRSILSQSFINYEIVIQEDASGDNIEEVIEAFNDPRIKFFRNAKNLTYAINLETARKNCSGDIIFLMGQDDILASGALMETYEIFVNDESVGAIARPYFQFYSGVGDISKPVRAWGRHDLEKNEIIKISDGYEKVIGVFRTLDQLSGLAYRVKFMDVGFHPDCFPCHVYPFASIFKKHPIVYLNRPNVAVRISCSQTRSISSIYEKSPLLSWVEMFANVFFEDEFKELKNNCIKNFVAVNYVGLVQLRNYARYWVLVREIWYLLKYRWYNIFNPQFWFFSLGCLITPPPILIILVDWYKNKINSKKLKNIEFNYQFKSDEKFI